MPEPRATAPDLLMYRETDMAKMRARLAEAEYLLARASIRLDYSAEGAMSLLHDVQSFLAAGDADA